MWFKYLVPDRVEAVVLDCFGARLKRLDGTEGIGERGLVYL
jgi:hypothetical protein